MEKYKKVAVDLGVSRYPTDIIVSENSDGLRLRIRIGQKIDGSYKDVICTFPTYNACMKFDEHFHPCDFSYVGLPEMEEGSGGVYPLLQVSESYWSSRIPDLTRKMSGLPTNFRFFSVNETVDVLSEEKPEFSWVTTPLLAEGGWRCDGDYFFFISLGEEDGPERCSSLGCSSLRISQSTKCRVHHFEMVMNYDPQIRR